MKKHLWMPAAALVSMMALVAVPQAEVIEDFEDGNWTEYTVVGDVQAAVTAAAAHDGNYGLEFIGHAGGEGWIYRDDAQVHVEQGNVVGFWSRTMEVMDNYTRNYHGFGATAAGCYSVVIAPNTGTLILQFNSGYGYSTLADVPQVWQMGHWYYLEIDWQVGGTITAYLYDSDGTTLLNTVSAVHNTFTGGGIAMRSFDNGYVAYFDTISRDGGITPVAESTWGGIKSLYR